MSKIENAHSKITSLVIGKIGGVVLVIRDDGNNSYSAFCLAREFYH